MEVYAVESPAPKGYHGRRLKDRPEEVDRVCFFEGIFQISIESDRSRERNLSGLGLGPPPSPSLAHSLFSCISLYYYTSQGIFLSSHSQSLFFFSLLLSSPWEVLPTPHPAPGKLIFTTSFLQHIVTTAVSQKSPLTRSIYIQVPTGSPSPSHNLR